jgi:F0F1-type ATP synthase assembly protein I
LPQTNRDPGYGRYAVLTALVYDFIGTIGAGALVGWLVDRYAGTGPYLAMAGTLLGAVGGFVRLFAGLRRLDRGRE